MRRQWLLAALILTLLLAAGTWLYFNVELRSERIRTGYSTKAEKDPYLAAQYFLVRTGTPVHTISNLFTLRTLPPTGATLFINTPRTLLSAKLRRRLLDWVHRGGQLIVVSWTLAHPPGTQAGPSQGHDRLLDPLGVRQYENRPKTSDADNTPGKPALIRFGNIDERLRVRFDPRFYLKDSRGTATDHITDATGTHLLHYRLGRGGITVLSDDDFMRNTGIGSDDNAAFLWHLAHWNAQNNGVWIVLSDAMPPLPIWLFDYARPVLIALALLLLAWLWRAARRFGPPLPDAPLARRSLREHLLASGRFLWHHGHHARLLEDCRLALRRRIDTVHPGWTTLAPAALVQQLAALGALPADDINTALNLPPRRNEHEFTRLVGTLETLRKSL